MEAGALVTCGWAHGKGVAATVATKARATMEMCMVIGFVDGIFGDWMPVLKTEFNRLTNANHRKKKPRLSKSENTGLWRYV